MVIVGLGHKRYKDYGECVPETCKTCHNQVLLHLFKVSEWGNFNILPFRYGTEHFLTCPICGWGYKVKKKGVEPAVQLVAATGRFAKKEITEAEYQKLIAESLLRQYLVEARS